MAPLSTIMAAPNGPPDLPPRTKRAPRVITVPKIQLPGKALLALPAALLLVIGAWTSFYQIDAEEVGVVLRFGRYSDTTEPGLRFKLPYGIDRVRKVAVRRQMKQEFGFSTSGATYRYQAASPDEQQSESQMVTGDLNAATVEWVVQFRIDNPREYLFSVRDPDRTLRHASESVMREAVGDRTVDEVLTVGRQEIEAEAL